MVGGYDGNWMPDAYVYDWTMQLWIQLAEMPTAQDRMACTLYRDGQGGEHVLTAGVNYKRNTICVSVNWKYGIGSGPSIIGCFHRAQRVAKLLIRIIRAGVAPVGVCCCET